MFNLFILQHSIENNSDSISHCCIDSHGSRMFSLNANTLRDNRSMSVKLDVDDSTQFSGLALVHDEALCCTDDKGAIRYITKIDEKEPHVELVGKIDSGIHTMSWSPDGDLVLFLTGNATIFCLSGNWEFIREVPLTLPQKPVTNVRVSWQADGQRFVTSVTDPTSSVVSYTVWDRACNRLAECEQKGHHKESAVALRPSSGLIAGASGKQVLLFEMNGLRHRQFDLPAADVTHMLWDPTYSRVLAVVYSTFVLLYERHNYKWDLKLKLVFAEDDPVVRCIWAEEAPLVLVTALKSGTKHTHRFGWDTCVSSGDSAWAAVIDGASVRLTPLHRAVIPPPMCALTISFPECVTSVAWSSAGTEGVALLCDSRVFSFSCANGSVEEAACDVPELPRQIAWGPHVLGANRKRALRVMQARDGTLLYSMESGDIVDVEDGMPMFECSQPCHWMEAVSSEVVVSLSANHHLYVSGTLVSEKCTTFKIHKRHILFVTHDNVLHTATFDGVVDENFSRELERGSMLIAASTSGPQAVLQVPRGNLECIVPRPFLYDDVHDYLVEKQYLTAFLLMRKHKIELNRLVSDNQRQFIEDADLVISQFRNQDHINLLLASLDDSQASPVCAALRNSMLADDEDHFMLAILTSLVKQRPTATEEALLRIKNMDDEEKASEALDYLVFLVRGQELYDVALGICDFKLARMIARRIQMDPQEFEPFLAELEKLPDWDRRFRVLSHLSRWTDVLKVLLEAEERWDQTAAHIKEHRLYQDAVELSSGDPRCYALLAQYLSDKGRFIESAAASANAGDRQAEAKAYVTGGHWQLALRAGADVEELASTMQVLRRFSEAAHLLAFHLDRKDEAAEVLLEAGLWEEALQFGADCTAVVTSLATELASEIRGNQVKWTTYVGRLVALRKNRAEAETMDGGLFLNRPDDDTSSVYSTGSSYSTASSSSSLTSLIGRKKKKKKRKKVRNRRGKKITGKPGSMHEEEFLCKELRSLVPSQDALKDVHKLLRGCLAHQLVDLAKTLQNDMIDLIELCERDKAHLLLPCLVFDRDLQMWYQYWRPQNGLYQERRFPLEEGEEPDDEEEQQTSLVDSSYAWKLIF